MRKVLFPATLLACSIGISLALLELGLTLLSDHAHARMATEFSEAFHHNYKPHYEGHRNPSPVDGVGRVPIRTNALGMRGGPLAWREHAPRVLVLGDSFIQADEIAEENTLGRLLANEMPRWDVAEHGYASWSPVLELNWLRRHFEALRPNLVVLVLCANDFVGEDAGYGDAYYLRDTVLDAAGFPARFTFGARRQQRIQHVYRATLPNLRTVASGVWSRVPEPFLSQEILDAMQQAPTPDALEALLDAEFPTRTGGALEMSREYIRVSRAPRDWAPKTKRQVMASDRHIRLLHRFLGEHGADLVLSLTPFGWNVAANQTVAGKASYGIRAGAVLSDAGIEAFVRTLAAELSVPYFDIKSALKPHAAAGAPLFFPVDGHWTERSHRLLAEALAPFLAHLDAAAP